MVSRNWSNYLNSVPPLLVGIVGLILALAFYRKYPKPAALVLIAMVLLVVNALRWPLFDLFLTDELRAGPTDRYVRMLHIQGWVGSSLNMVVLALLLCAAFSGRSHAQPGGFPMQSPQQPHPTRPPPMPPQY